LLGVKELMTVNSNIWVTNFDFMLNDSQSFGAMAERLIVQTSPIDRVPRLSPLSVLWNSEQRFVAADTKRHSSQQLRYAE